MAKTFRKSAIFHRFQAVTVKNFILQCAVKLYKMKQRTIPMKQLIR